MIPITAELVAQMDQANTFTHMTPNNAQAPTADYAYRIGAGDILNMRLWDGIETPNIKGYAGSQEQTFAVNVEDNGMASFPYVGSITVQNLTVAELRQSLSKKLSRYFRTPRFDLQLQQARSQHITVSGAVTKPGVQYLNFEPLTVVKAIEKAGGVEPFADLDNAVIVHANGAREPINVLALLHNADQSQDRVLQAGDTLLLPERHRNEVFLMGDLLKTGIVHIRAGRMSLNEALNTSEGVNRETQGPNNITGLTGTIYVIRGAVNTTTPRTPTAQAQATPALTIYSLDSQSPTYYALANRFPLQPQDVVFVSASMVTEWHRFITQLLPVNVGAAKSLD